MEYSNWQFTQESTMQEYRVIKVTIKEGNWNPVNVYFLQTKNSNTWHTLNASMFITDIKHTCQEGRNQAEKMQAYKDFTAGV